MIVGKLAYLVRRPHHCNKTTRLQNKSLFIIYEINPFPLLFACKNKQLVRFLPIFISMISGSEQLTSLGTLKQLLRQSFSIKVFWDNSLDKLNKFYCFSVVRETKRKSGITCTHVQNGPSHDWISISDTRRSRDSWKHRGR